MLYYGLICILNHFFPCHNNLIAIQCWRDRFILICSVNSSKHDICRRDKFVLGCLKLWQNQYLDQTCNNSCTLLEFDHLHVLSDKIMLSGSFLVLYQWHLICFGKIIGFLCLIGSCNTPVAVKQGIAVIAVKQGIAVIAVKQGIAVITAWIYQKFPVLMLSCKVNFGG